MKISAADHARITAAIAAAESQTSGEIFCVVARRVSAYHDVALAWAAGAALTLPLLLIPLGIQPSWIPGLSSAWGAAHLSAQNLTTAGALTTYALAQAVTFVAVFGLALIGPVRRLLTPPGVRRSRIHDAALSQFLAHGLQATEGRTGVLIFAALDDHGVEIIADQGIHARVAPDVWADAVQALAREMKAGRPVDGFDAAIRLCGAVLAEHFPPGARNPDELANRLVEI